MLPLLNDVLIILRLQMSRMIVSAINTFAAVDAGIRSLKLYQNHRTARAAPIVAAWGTERTEPYILEGVTARHRTYIHTISINPAAAPVAMLQMCASIICDLLSG